MSWDILIKAPDATADEFDRNLTYNNSKMLARAGAHPRMWNGKTVDQLRIVVAEAHALICDNRSYFMQFNPPIDPDTGKPWGGIDDVIKYLEQLGEYLVRAPDTYVMVVV